MVGICFTQSVVQTATRNLETNCGRLSVTRFDEELNLGTQISKTCQWLLCRLSFLSLSFSSIRSFYLSWRLKIDYLADFWTGFQVCQYQRIQRVRPGKKFKLPFVLSVSMVMRIRAAIADRCVNVTGFVRPIQPLLHRIVQSTLPRVSRW